MLFRKIEREIERHLLSTEDDRILIVEGARQTGKSFIIRAVGKRLFRDFVEINFAEDAEGGRLFSDVHTIDEFYLRLSIFAGKQLVNRETTLVFLDEIQQYPQFLTLLKFLRQDGKFRYIASGSLLGIALSRTTSIPVGSVVRKQMFQLDFEEFLTACGVGGDAVAAVRESCLKCESLDESVHNHLMSLFRRYLLVGGMPDAVNAYLRTQNIVSVRSVQQAILTMYADDASKYEQAASRRLLIRRIYEMIPSQMENKKKRVVARDIRDREGDRFSRYEAEFEYLVSSGIANAVRAVANPSYPLTGSVQKNLLKLYMNDVGMLTARLYGNNIEPILNDQAGVNLGGVYETAVAQELRAHGAELFYYDNRHRGEVDFLINDSNRLSVVPIEVKSGKDYKIHSALNNLLSVPDYGVGTAVVLSNARQMSRSGNIAYLPVYAAMFLGMPAEPQQQIF